MEFSDSFVRRMTRPFHTVLSADTNTRLTSSLTFDRNNIFSKSLVIDITGDDIEIPSIVRASYESIIYNNLTYSDIYRTEKIILPLYVNNNRSKETFNGIMGEFFSLVPFSSRLLKITTNKGETYYGGFGLILDEGFNPLLMCGLKARPVIIETNSGVKATFMQYYRAVCHISPTVFTEPNKLINKGIIKKLIPIYTTVNVTPGTFGSAIIYSFDSRKVEVIIDDFSKFFITPIAPTPSKCSNDILNKCLNDNIEDILYLI